MIESNRITIQKKIGRAAEVIIFTSIYFVCFYALERRSESVNLIYAAIDEMIPFIDVFVIPYIYWFIYLICGIVYFIMCAEDEEYYSFTRMLALGAVTFIAISYFYPNYIMLRPNASQIGNGICGNIVNIIYQSDTPTNVFPSMHVFCSVACYIAVKGNEALMKSHSMRFINTASVLLICCSTVFLKQHSVIDVVGALVMNMILYRILYHKRQYENDKAISRERSVN